MKQVIKHISRTIGAIALIMSVVSVFASDMEIRFVQIGHNTEAQELYVDVQVRNVLNYELVMAGQNYRFYYDSEVLLLDVDNSESNLPVGIYGELMFDDHISGIEADHVNQLAFDDNLGFANFSIDLSDVDGGGVRLAKDEWFTVATLQFDVLKTDQSYEIVWGREGMSDLYATAFVEIGEWMSSNMLGRVNIIHYGDLNAEFSLAHKEINAKAHIGPNPATEYVQVDFRRDLKKDAVIILRDFTGRPIKRQVVARGNQSTKINISDMLAMNYLVEIHNEGFVQSQQLIVVK